MIKKAMILAAGFGKRLNPLTLNCPKPLLKIGEETLISNTIKFLSSFKVEEIIINVHYLGNQIIEYINKKDFNLSTNIVLEKDQILDTGGGILNAIDHFSNEPFIVVNPDTIWNLSYIKYLKLMEKEILNNQKNKCTLLIVNKKKSFDKKFKGDFNFENNSINRKNKENLNYIYTGLQIIKPEIFSGVSKKIFSMNTIWDKLIKRNELYGVESRLDFLHVSNLDIYNKLNIK